MTLLQLSPSFLSCSFFRITINVLLWYDSFQWYKCCIISPTNKLLRAKSFTTARTHSFILIEERRLKYNGLLGNSFPSINWLQFIYISLIYNIFVRIITGDQHLSSWSVINQKEHNIAECYKSQFQWECLNFHQSVEDIWMVLKPTKTDVIPGTQNSIFLKQSLWIFLWSHSVLEWEELESSLIWAPAMFKKKIFAYMQAASVSWSHMSSALVSSKQWIKMLTSLFKHLVS